MNRPPVLPSVSDRAVDAETAELRLNQEVIPVLRRVRALANDLSANEVLTLLADGEVDPKYDLILVNAAAAPVDVTLPVAREWSRRILVIKTDATANAVLIPDVVSGPVTLSSQWDVLEVAADGDVFYRVNSAGAGALAGDVTGPAVANTVSLIQTVPVDLTTTPPVEGDHLVYDGSAIVPMPAYPRVFDNTYSPVGNWWMINDNDEDVTQPKDHSGNGYHLTVEAGTQRFVQIAPQLNAIYFGGATNLVRAASTPALALTGDMTMIWIGSSDDPQAAVEGLWAGHLGPTDLAVDNALYAGYTKLAPSPGFTYFSENGVGVNQAYANEGYGKPNLVHMMGFVRRSNVINLIINGYVGWGGPSSSLTPPDGGGSGRFRVGGQTGEYLKGAMCGLCVYNRALTNAEIKERYNYALGRAYGWRV